MKSYGMMTDIPELSTMLRQFQAHDDVFESIEQEIIEEERPPMITIPEYLEKRGNK
jgi:glucosyl-3-phosphoglycerate synthase